MVHTRRFESADQAYLSRLAATAFASSKTFRYIRPTLANYPEHFEWNRSQGIRRSSVTPGYVIRVAVADDSDAFTDLSRSPIDGWPRGAWTGGEWVSEESALPPKRLKVAEGRILGFNKWERTWPVGEDAALQAKARSGGVWPEDNLMKKIDRTLYQIGDKYTELIGYDHSVDKERMSAVLTDGKAELAAIWGPITEGLKHTTGYITCKDVVVDPLFHGRGIGSHMMQWGIQQAEREGVPIMLLASTTGQRLYAKNGFESLGRLTTKVLENETPMIYWPGGVKRIEAPKRAVNSDDKSGLEEVIV